VDDLLGDSEDESPSSPQKPSESLPPRLQPSSVEVVSLSSSEEAEQLPTSPPLSNPAASRRLSSEGTAKCKKKSLVCSQCGDSFREGEFSAHARQNHAYPCAFCSLSFTYVNGRDNHQNAAHTPESVASQKKVFCSICGLGFPRTATLNKHAKREHDVPCRDRTCRRRFTNASVMEAHAAESHGLFRTTGGAAAPAKAASASVGKSSPPVRVRNQHYGAAIVDSSAGRKNSGNSVVKSDRSDSNVLKKTKARLCAAFNIDENTKKKPAATAEGPKKKKGRPKKSQTASAAPSSSPAPVVAEKDDTMCEQCGKQIPDFEEFFEHINTDHTESCSICFMAFVHDFYLREHKYLRHGCARPPITDRPPSPPPRSRPDRGKPASPAGDGDSDSEADMDDDLLLPDISPLNPEPPRQSSAYRIPKLNKDPSVPGVLPLLEFPCDDCSESFSTAAALVKHLQERHYDPTRPGSSSSDRSSSTASTLLRPQTLVPIGGTGNTCAECGQSFSTVDALKAHADSTHLRKEAQSSGARRPEQACHLCGEKFPRDRIGQHLLKSHPDGRAPVGGPPPAAAAPTAAGRELTCDLCGREFRYVPI
jgi:hypothetical protein